MSDSITSVSAPDRQRLLGSVRSLRIHIVMPALNEAEGLSKLLPELKQSLDASGYEYHVVVVDDGSTDDTIEVVAGNSLSMPVSCISHEENRGLAAAMRTGLTSVVEMADPEDIIITMDGDNTHKPWLVSRMVQAVLEGRDVVIASRYRPGARIIGLSLFRRFTSFAARTLFVCLFPVSGVRDYTCGYRAYRCQILRQAMNCYREQFISEDGFSCMVDILIKLNRQGAIFGEVPMILRYDLKHGASKMRVGRTIADTLKLAAKRRLDFLHTREAH